MRKLVFRHCSALAMTLALLAALTPVAHAKHRRITCRSGTTVLVQGALRVIAIPFRSQAEGVYRGEDLYACRGTAGRPISVGSIGADEGTDSDSIPAMAFDGVRYLAVDADSDGEGGPSYSYHVIDLKTGRSGAYANGVGGDDVEPAYFTVPAFRVTAAGALLTSDNNIHLVSPGSRSGSGRLLSTPGVDASEAALAGTTAYWTETPDKAPAIVRSTTLAGPAAARENTVFAPIYIPSAGTRCDRRVGLTIARSVGVRVFQTTSGSRYACSNGAPRLVRLRPPMAAPGLTSTADDVRIVNDRWLLTLDPETTMTAVAPEQIATVTDMTTGVAVTTVHTAAGVTISDWALLPNGALAWIVPGGPLLAQPVSADAPTVLAPATDAPSALACANGTVYWTAGGAPHAARIGTQPHGVT